MRSPRLHARCCGLQDVVSLVQMDGHLSLACLLMDTLQFNVMPIERSKLHKGTHAARH